MTETQHSEVNEIYRYVALRAIYTKLRPVGGYVHRPTSGPAVLLHRVHAVGPTPFLGPCTPDGRGVESNPDAAPARYRRSPALTINRNIEGFFHGH